MVTPHVVRSSAEQHDPCKCVLARCFGVVLMKPIRSLDCSVATAGLLDCRCYKLAEGTASDSRRGAVDRKGLEAMLLHLQKVDLDSVARVSDSKVSPTRITDTQ